MRTHFILVDFENVKDVDLRDLNREDVRVILFLGNNQKKVPTELAVQMQALGERGQYVQISGNGPNALDFHIAFTIGEKCRTEDQSFFHIISKDAGFDPLIAYLKGKRILAARHKSIGDAPFIMSSQPKTAATRAAYLMEKLGSPKATKPRTAKTLSNAVRTVFHRHISDKDVEDVIAALCSRGFVTITDGKVSYSDQAARTTVSS
ncbi:MAG: PIN domain-containing protein [Fimbriimonadaceae bacterium]